MIELNNEKKKHLFMQIITLLVKSSEYKHFLVKNLKTGTN